MSRNQDLEHLRLLSIFHFVLAGLLALASAFPLIYLAIGVAAWSGEFGSGHREDQFMGSLFVSFGALGFLCALGLATAVFLAGRYLRDRRRRTYCLVVAGAECIFSPLGTVLGIFTILILVKDGVRELFED